MRQRDIVPNVLVALLVAGTAVSAASCAGPPVDLAKALKVTDVVTGWYDAGILADGRNKLVPSISFRLTNVGTSPVSSVYVTLSFRIIGDEQELGSSYIKAVGYDGLAAGASTGPMVARSSFGYAGFRVHYPIKQAGYKDEVIVFVGASYFRAIGKQHVYGLSARALAVDTALPSGEEFPFFKEYWLVRPAPGAHELEIYALLDSPRLTGAYHFTIYPGDQTLVDVESRVFLRKKVGKIGIAPLTSMFFSGENALQRVEDYRPEVHDSDGLLLFDATGEWTWRPLRNPRTLTVNSFGMTNPRGFGLIQRDRDFEHYQDLETRMETRPSVWIAPKGDWGAGGVELVQIPTQADIHDNIVAYWVPEQPADPAKPLDFAYRMTWYGDDAAHPPAGRVIASRRDRGTFEDGYRFVIDFQGRQLETLSAETVLQGVVTVGEGELLEQQVVKNPVNAQWRLTFQVRPRGGNPVEMRAFLKKGEEALTETWSYVLEP